MRSMTRRAVQEPQTYNIFLQIGYFHRRFMLIYRATKLEANVFNKKYTLSCERTSTCKQTGRRQQNRTKQTEQNLFQSKEFLNHFLKINFFVINKTADRGIGSSPRESRV